MSLFSFGKCDFTLFISEKTQTLIHFLSIVTKNASITCSTSYWESPRDLPGTRKESMWISKSTLGGSQAHEPQ